MLPTFVITLREGVGAALILGIVVAFLKQQGRDALRWMWAGVLLAVGCGGRASSASRPQLRQPVFCCSSRRAATRARRPRYWRQPVRHRRPFQRDPHRQFAAIQRRLGERDSLTEYIKHVGSGLFAVPPGAQPDGFVGEGLFKAV